jgi:hypothetical protein
MQLTSIPSLSWSSSSPMRQILAQPQLLRSGPALRAVYSTSSAEAARAKRHLEWTRPEPAINGWRPVLRAEVVGLSEDRALPR